MRKERELIRMERDQMREKFEREERERIRARLEEEENQKLQSLYQKSPEKITNLEKARNEKKKSFKTIPEESWGIQQETPVQEDP